MENRRIKKILEATRKSEFILMLILALVISMFIGLCAHATNMKKELNLLHKQMINVQQEVYDIKYEVTK